MKIMGFGLYNYDDMVFGTKEMETQKQITMFREAGLQYTPTEQEIVVAAQNQTESVKRDIFKTMDVTMKKGDMVEALKEMEQGQITEVLHDVIQSGTECFKLNDIVHLIKNRSVHDQQAIVDMAELKIVPTDEQIEKSILHKPPGNIFRIISKAGIVPNKRNMLSLLLDFAENDQGVPDLIRALRRAGIDVINDDELIFAILQRNAKQQEEIIQAVNPDMILFNLENVTRKFENLSANKQTKWLQALRETTGAARMEDILETLSKFDSVQLEHFLKLCRDRGIIQGHTYNKEELIETMAKMDSQVKKEALEEIGIIPTVRHLSYVLKEMEQEDVQRAIRASKIQLQPNLEEALFALLAFSTEDVSKAAHRMGVQLFTEADVVGFLLMMPDSEKKRIAKMAKICLCDFQEIMHAFRCLPQQKQKEIACAAGLMRRKLRLIR